MTAIKVTALSGVGISDDGQDMFLEFRDAAGEDLRLLITQKALSDAEKSIGDALAEAIMQSSDGVGLTRHTPAWGFRAISPVDPGIIILTFALPNGLEHSYSLPVESSDQVCNEIQIAADKNRRQTPLTRQ
jgi:hypothetical protein